MKKKRVKTGRLAALRQKDPSILAPIAVCSFVAGLVFPVIWVFSLLSLGLFGFLTVFFGSPRTGSSVWPPLTVPLFLLLLSTTLSSLGAWDVGESFWRSTGLVPVTLLFFLVAQHFHRDAHIWALYVTFSGVALAQACMVMWTVNMHGELSIRVLALAVRSPILRVPNDIAFLSVIAPLSLALIFRKPRAWQSAIAVVSLVLSVTAIVALRSRTALLTMMISLICFMLLVQPKRRLLLAATPAAGALGLTFLVDWLLGGRLANKFLSQWSQHRRFALWSTAWDMFLEAPLLGHGPGSFGQFNKTVPWAHNLYLEFLAERGIIGFAALMYLLVAGGAVAWHVQRDTAGRRRLLGASALAGLAGLCVAGISELTFHRFWVIVTLSTLLGGSAALYSRPTDREDC